MIGAIIGDIVGSRFEWNNYLKKDFELFTDDCFATDDSVMTLAVAKALVECRGNYSSLGAQAVKAMQEIGRHYPDCGFGGRFYGWLFSDNPAPYGSFGNGAAMRISPVGFVAKSVDEAKKLSRAVTEVTHNHLEGIKGAECTAVAIVLAREGKSKEEIKNYVLKNYYDIGFTVDEIRPNYHFNESCQGTVPQAMQAFFEADGFEDAIRTAISIGGDSDTLAAITGGVAEAYYGVSNTLKEKALRYLDARLAAVFYEFMNYFQL
jgi:ADP-ribosylglycohydrolase